MLTLISVVAALMVLIGILNYALTFYIVRNLKKEYLLKNYIYQFPIGTKLLSVKIYWSGKAKHIIFQSKERTLIRLYNFNRIIFFTLLIFVALILITLMKVITNAS